jgi:hypothetical protein
MDCAVREGALTSASAEEFVRAFRLRHDRAPRVMHIGNIANNAYLNAKLLTDAGFDCDVICYDYYHIMGCPEWEDADFTGDVGDHFRPEWTKVDLKGFVRPRWFVQGPQAQCLEYLIARNAGDTATAERMWRELGELNSTRVPTGLPVAPAEMKHWLSQKIFALRFAASRVTGVRHLRSVLRGQFGWLTSAVMFPFALAAMSTIWLLRHVRRVMMLVIERTFLSRAKRLVRDFAREFPDRADTLTMADLMSFAPFARRWRTVLAHYDVIIGYSTDGILPLLAERPYLAFEHGTLREIPFRQTAQGRTTALAYRAAKHVFVTNFDCLANAALLAPGRHTLLNHPFDEDHGLATSGADTERRALCEELDCEFVFFFPTRQDWVAGEGYADKGNDVFFRGMAALVRCEWGANIAHSKRLLAELGIADRVKWIAPLPTVAFERLSRAAHCVVDQFVLGSFGGVMFKAMAVGAPVLTYLEEAQLLRQYPVCPPVLNCRTPNDVVEVMAPLIGDAARLASIGQAGRQWMKTYHAKAGTVRNQMPAFSLCLAESVAQ